MARRRTGAPEIVERIRSLVRRGRYRLSIHAEQERDADRITIDELESALHSAAAELIEDYPEDPRGHSHLILGLAGDNPIHVVCAIYEQTLVIITVYRPDPKLWHNYRERREKP